MVSNNPYQPPKSNLQPGTKNQEYAEVTFFGNSRLGRVRYIAYSMGMAVLGYLVMAVIMISGLPEGVLVIAVLVISFVLLSLTIWFTIRRAHDFNTSGWLALLTIITYAFDRLDNW